MIKRAYLRPVCFFAVALSLMGSHSSAASNTTPTVALMVDKTFDLHESPLVSLLEAELSQTDGIQLLERSQIEEILREQQLQLMFSAGGVRERIAEGKLLKADLLILLRGREENQIRQLDIIIAETDSGLRLLVRTVLWPDDPSSDIRTIHNFTTQALKKYEGGITYICAVPPFVSNDLSHQYDFLQAAYSRVIEQTLLQYSGMVIVELEEAHAVAEEIMLAGSQVRVERKLPLYIMGEYRNEGVNENRTTSVRLTLEWGRQQLETITRQNLPPGEVGSFLRRQSRELLGIIGDLSQPLPDPVLEADLLARRAEAFISIAAWAQALALLEASLLLNPDQPALHYKAVYVITHLMSLYYDPYGDIENFTRKAIIGFDYYKLGLTHLESFLRSAKLNCSEHMNFISDFWAAARNVEQYSRCPAEIQRIASDLAKDKREMLLAVMAAKAQTGRLDDPTADLLSNYLFLSYVKIDETLQRNYADRLRAIRIISDLPGARQWTLRLAGYQISPAQLAAPAYETFIAQVAAISNKNVRSACEDLSRWRETELKQTIRPYKNSTTPPDHLSSEPQDVLFNELQLACEGSSGNSTSLATTTNLWGWLACSEGIDFVWGPKQVYLMKEKGRLKCIYKSDQRSFNIVNPCCDGEYAWVPVMREEGPLVLVIDPVTERITEFTSEDGLPPMHTTPVSAGLAPGEICLAAGLRGRGWCALLKLSEEGEKMVDIIHEARQTVIKHGLNAADVTNADLAFCPRFMKVISNPKDNSDKRVIVGRSTDSERASLQPLIIEPKSRSVRVMPCKMAGHLLDNYLTCHEGALYWVEHTGPNQQSNLCRISFENLNKAAVIRQLSEPGLVAFANGVVHIVGEHWWAARTLDDKFVRLKAKLPRGSWDYYRLSYSSHYGLLIIYDECVYDVDFRSVSLNGLTYQELRKAAITEE